MDLRSLKPQPETPAARTEQLLESHYEKFLKWAVTLTRGDVGKAEEIVQEFCLYLALTKPDLRNVTNLDGYFYISLRNLYQSSLARSAREAMRFVSVAEFDSIRVALAGNRGGDTLERQNDLRCICSYAIWRKNQSKGFCYFILHFFHGYFRREIAEMAGVPLSAIYNKLHAARSEVKAHLEDQDRGKFRVLSKKAPPEPSLLWHRISESNLFKELRATILNARNSPCLSEEELLARFRTSVVKPISCGLLSHIVSCERCLEIVDRHFQRPMLEDREPLDSTGAREGTSGSKARNMDQMKKSFLLRTVRSRFKKTYEHRPRTLCIAVNGKIVASHDVQGIHSTLAARIEFPEQARFIEIFSEQDVRLAMLPVGEAPPEGAPSVAQRVKLSDDRWLELNLVYDGMGLNSEVIYFDPILGIAAEETDTEEAHAANASQDAHEVIPVSDALPQRPETARRRRRFDWTNVLVPSHVLSWALVLIAVSFVAGYFVYRHANRPLNAQQILSRSMKLEAVALRGTTEHQVLKVEEVSASGQILQLGTVDVWKDGNGDRYLRELYNSEHHAIAAEWRVGNVMHHVHLRGKAVSFASIPWSEDVSVRTFDAMSAKPPQLRRIGTDYALTVEGPVKEHPRLVSATLVLNRRLLFVREALRLRDNSHVYEVRFVQTAYSYQPSGSVPDERFEPAKELLRSQDEYNRSVLDQLSHGASRPQLAELEIGVLYQLSQVGADTGEPIAIHPTSDGHLRVLGAITSKELKQRIVSRLRVLPNHRYLQIELGSQNSEVAGSIMFLHNQSGNLSVYDVGGTRPLVAPLVRRYFEKQGLAGKSLDSATTRFSLSVLTLAQHALQNSYALDRLGMVFSIAKANSVSPRALNQWSSMVVQHASSLGAQMHSLHAQLTEILPVNQTQLSATQNSGKITDTVQFASSAQRLLQKVQNVNRNVDLAFAANSTTKNGKSAEALLASTIKMLPMSESAEMKNLAQHLSHAQTAVTTAENKRQTGAGVTPQ